MWWKHVIALALITSACDAPVGRPSDGFPIVTKAINIPLRTYNIHIKGRVRAKLTVARSKQPIILKGTESAINRTVVEARNEELFVTLDAVSEEVELFVTRRCLELYVSGSASAMVTLAGGDLDMFLSDSAYVAFGGYMCKLELNMSDEAAAEGAYCVTRDVIARMSGNTLAEVHSHSFLEMYLTENAFLHAYGHPRMLRQVVKDEAIFAHTPGSPRGRSRAPYRRTKRTDPDEEPEEL